MRRAAVLAILAAVIGQAQNAGTEAERLRLVYSMGHRPSAVRVAEDPVPDIFGRNTIAPIAAPLLTGAALAGILVQHRRILRRMRRSLRRSGGRVVRRMMA